MFSFEDLLGVKTVFNIFRLSSFYLQHLDRCIMQDIEWEHRCVMPSMFLTLFRVCTLCVIMITILFTLDEFDTERAVMALIRFMKKF